MHLNQKHRHHPSWVLMISNTLCISIPKVKKILNFPKKTYLYSCILDFNFDIIITFSLFSVGMDKGNLKVLNDAISVVSCKFEVK